MNRDNQLDEAIDHYRRAARRGLDREMANNFGIALARKHRLREAIGQFQAVLTLDPNSAPAHANLGWMLDEAGQDDEAAFHYGRAIESDRFLLQPRYMLARLRAGKAGLTRRLPNSSSCSCSRRVMPTITSELAALLSAQGRLDEAIAHYRQALQLAPNHAAAHAGLDKLLGAQPVTR